MQVRDSTAARMARELATSAFAAIQRFRSKGLPADTNLDTHTPMRMRCARSRLGFLPRTQPPTGLGEPGMTVVAPAIANAVFAAVGGRQLPIRPEAVPQTMNARI
jgi:isoquinoline 1-oxidoreductase beta subunit